MTYKYGDIFNKQNELHKYNIRLLNKKGWSYNNKHSDFDGFKKEKKIMQGFPYASSSKLRVKLLLENSKYNTEFIYFNKKTYRDILNENLHIFNHELLFLKKSNGSQGKHVHPVVSMEDVIKIMENKYKNYDDNTIFILEKGINKPLLFKEKKFDMRIYLLFIRKEDQYYSYLYPEWFVRTSSTKYNANSLSKKNMLTNTSITGKTSKNQFIYQKIPTINGIDTNILNKKLYPCLTYFSEKWKQHLKEGNLKYFGKELNSGLQFNLFGIDIIIDEKLNPYVLEINYNPLFGPSKSIKDIGKLKKKMWKSIIYNYIHHYNKKKTINSKNFIELNNNNDILGKINNIEYDNNDDSDDSDNSDDSDDSDDNDDNNDSDDNDDRDHSDDNDSFFEEIDILTLFPSLKKYLNN